MAACSGRRFVWDRELQRAVACVLASCGLRRRCGAPHPHRRRHRVARRSLPCGLPRHARRPRPHRRARDVARGDRPRRGSGHVPRQCHYHRGRAVPALGAQRREELARGGPRAHVRRRRVESEAGEPPVPRDGAAPHCGAGVCRCAFGCVVAAAALQSGMHQACKLCGDKCVLGNAVC